MQAYMEHCVGSLVAGPNGITDETLLALPQVRRRVPNSAVQTTGPCPQPFPSPPLFLQDMRVVLDAVFWASEQRSVYEKTALGDQFDIREAVSDVQSRLAAGTGSGVTAAAGCGEGVGGPAVRCAEGPSLTVQNAVVYALKKC